jgi:phytoene dehydrogenase-like protein
VHRCAAVEWTAKIKRGSTGRENFQGVLEPHPTQPARPMLGRGKERTPLKSLYLCDSGAQPGGEVAGIAGHHAAREILRDWLKSVRGPNR